jgi:acetate kinase
MNILVINSGSSSIKYQLFSMPDHNPLCSGLVERIGLENSSITHKVYVQGKEKRLHLEINVADHKTGMLEIGKLLTNQNDGVIKHPEDIHVVGHRVVHGGEKFKQTTVITPAVKEEIKKLFPLAPLHNPGNYQGILVAQTLFKKAVHIAVFDTAFHQTISEKAFRYAIPVEYYEKHGIRVYGFHGISHQYVASEAAKYLQQPDAKIITIHLGNGCSMAAINSGKSLDTSMGLTPLDGLIMGTRCGNIDPSVIFHLMSELGMPAKQAEELLNKESGMLGLAGSNDMRDIRQMIDSNDHNAMLACEMYAYRIKKFIGAYAAAMNGLDAIVFTAGIGENDPAMREMVCSEMDFLGIHLDNFANRSTETGLKQISSAFSRVKALVIPTNEELEIAEQCQALANQSAHHSL